MGPFIAAWLVGEGIISYRAISKTHAPPIPGALLASSGLFAMLALLAESDTLRPAATALAWGFDIAALLNLWPAVTGGAPSSSSTAASSPTATAAAAKSATLATPAQSSTGG